MAAIKLYEKFGFVQEGYRRAHYRRGDQFTDAILMAYMI
jgi:RimJ/RimL family protein N-acetyltransferase